MSWLTRVRDWLEDRPLRADTAALILLTALWGFYFWRALTPNPTNQVSYPLGDFSGQFLAFGAYQARRLLQGQVPLWNPFNYAGHPFIADTQAAVFYPPRLITIVVSHFTGGWSYAALQAEAIAHYWLASVWMYLFVRTVTRSRIAGIVSAITLAYGGYLTGYPPLQLAVLEAGSWLPLSLLGVFKASQGGRWNARWLAVAALALGLSLLAGHPQTSLFLSYMLLAYIVHRTVKQKIDWKAGVAALVGTLGTGYALAGVQVLPGLEYTRLTIRASYGFDALAGGFPFSDAIVFLIPNVVTVWSPLYSGIAALALAGVAIWQKEGAARFWAVVAGVALVVGFGGATVLYRLAYLIAPGFAWFRGQERAAYVIAYAVAILAGLGAAHMLRQPLDRRGLARVLGIGAAAAWVFAVEAFIGDRLWHTDNTFMLLEGAVFMAGLLTATWALIGRLGARSQSPWWAAGLLALVVFDVFSLTWKTNWEHIPASQRVLYNQKLVPLVQADDSLFRVDGRLGLASNYGTMLGVQDIRGISPLRLETLEQYQNVLPDDKLYQILSVKYVFTDGLQLPEPSTILASDDDHGTLIHLHEISNPFPRAWMAYTVMDTPDEAQALGWLADPGFDARTTVTLPRQPALSLPGTVQQSSVTVTDYEPERIAIHADTPTDGVLVVSEMDYPGWQATVDGQRVSIWRADVGLRALPLKAGQHDIVMVYRPLSVTLGAVASLLALATIIAGMVTGWHLGAKQEEAA